MEIGKAETMNSGQGTIGSVLGDGRRALSEEVLVGYKRTEVGVIPEEWSVFYIGELFDYLRTASNSRADLGDTGVVAYVHYGDIHTRFHHFIDFSRDNVPRLLAGKSVTAARLRDGDLIVADASEDEAGVGKSVEVRNLGTTEAVSGLHTFLLRSKDRRVHDGYRGYLLEKEPVKGQLRRLATGLKVFGISKQALRDVRIPLPSPAEQRTIAEALSDVDGLLAALETLIAKKRAIKQAAMLQLLTGKSRLPGFSGAWETKKISEVATYCNEKNSLAEDLPVLTCSKHLGFVDSLRYFKNQVFSKDLRGYKIIRRGQIGYPANHIEEGSIGLQDLYDVALVSPIYVVCSPKAGINSYFLHRLLKLDCYRQEFAIATTSSIDRRGSLKWSAFSELVVNLPYVDEQRAIASVLSDMDAEIASLERRRDKTRVVKQGMMQQLLTGRVRLVEFEALTKKTTT